VRTPHDIPYYEGDKLSRRRDREDRNKLQFDLEENVVNSSNNSFEQPSDKEEDVNKTPNKADTKPIHEEEEQPLPSSESKEKQMGRHDAMMNKKMKCLFATFTENTQK
jgi:hypothetical protein